MTNEQRYKEALLEMLAIIEREIDAATIKNGYMHELQVKAQEALAESETDKPEFVLHMGAEIGVMGDKWDVLEDERGQRVTCCHGVAHAVAHLRMFYNLPEGSYTLRIVEDESEDE